MTLHPQAQTLLDQLAAANVPPFEQMTLAQAREAINGIKELAGTPEDVAHVEDRTILSSARKLDLRIYTPQGQAPFPVLVFFHGGGWIAGDLDTMDVPLRVLANRAGCIVVSVDYSLAPEYPFPIPLEDAYVATRWVIHHAESFSGDAKRVAIGGDSSGGNLAAAVTLMAKAQGEFSLAYQLLVCPVTNYEFRTVSYQKYGQGYLLTKGAMQWFWQHYLKEAAEGQNPYASPLRATDFTGLPPALVITAEYDPLRDEGEAYAEQLKASGVPVITKRYDGMMHGFYQMAAVIDGGQSFIEDTADILKTTLSAT